MVYTRVDTLGFDTHSTEGAKGWLSVWTCLKCSPRLFEMAGWLTPLILVIGKFGRVSQLISAPLRVNVMGYDV